MSSEVIVGHERSNFDMLYCGNFSLHGMRKAPKAKNGRYIFTQREKGLSSTNDEKVTTIPHLDSGRLLAKVFVLSSTLAIASLSTGGPLPGPTITFFPTLGMPSFSR